MASTEKVFDGEDFNLDANKFDMEWMFSPRTRRILRKTRPRSREECDRRYQRIESIQFIDPKKEEKAHVLCELQESGLFNLGPFCIAYICFHHFMRYYTNVMDVLRHMASEGPNGEAANDELSDRDNENEVDESPSENIIANLDAAKDKELFDRDNANLDYEDNIGNLDKDEEEKIFLMHYIYYLNTWFAFMLFGAVVVIAIQLIFPATLFFAEYDQYTGGWCQNAGSKYAKTVMFAISWLYMNRVCLGLMSTNAKRNLKGIRKRSFIHRHSALFKFMLLDVCFGNCYEHTLYLINLWLVFITDDPLDMILNSLAMEFFMKLDDESVEVCSQLFGLDLGHAIVRMELFVEQDKNKDKHRGIVFDFSQPWWLIFAQGCHAFISTFCLFVFFAMCFYGPICK